METSFTLRRKINDYIENLKNLEDELDSGELTRRQACIAKDLINFYITKIQRCELMLSKLDKTFKIKTQ
jgi:hypothetical protein